VAVAKGEESIQPGRGAGHDRGASDCDAAWQTGGRRIRDAAKAAKHPRGTTKPLLALLRSCPVDLTAIVNRDRSGPRKIDLK